MQPNSSNLYSKWWQLMSDSTEPIAVNQGEHTRAPVPEAGALSSAAVSCVRVQPKPPFLVALLSLFLPGLGQMLCCQDNKGVFLMAVSLLGWWSTQGASALILGPAMALDAYQIALQLTKAEPLRPWEFFSRHPRLNQLKSQVIPWFIILTVAMATFARIVVYSLDYDPNQVVIFK